MESDKIAAAASNNLLMDQCFNFTAQPKETLLIQCYLRFISRKHLMTNVFGNF